MANKNRSGLNPILIAYKDSNHIRVDPRWKKPKMEKKQRTLAEEIHIAVLKANRLGASGFIVTNLNFDDNSIVLDTEAFSPEELQKIAHTKNMSLSQHRSEMLDKVLQARVKKGLSTPNNTENLTTQEVDDLIATYESQP